MTEKHERHLTDIIASQAVRSQKKYLKGQKAHGGNMWEKKGMLTNAEQEITDTIAYHHVIRQQIELAILHLRQTHIAFALDILEGLLEEPEDC